MKDTGLNGYVYDFSIDYDSTDVDNIKDIHKYLMKKNNIVWLKMFRFVKQIFISAIIIFSHYLPSTNSLSCILINNQPCKARPEIY